MNRVMMTLVCAALLPAAASLGQARDSSRRSNFVALQPAAATDDFPSSSKLVVPGKGAESTLYKVLIGGDPMAGDFTPRMPPFGGHFPADKAELVRAWIDAGAQREAYDKGVGPMLKQSCAGCHSAAHATAGIGLDSFDSLVKSAHGQLHGGPIML